MIFYSWQTICKLANNKVKDIITLIKVAHLQQECPYRLPSIKDPIARFYHEDLRGTSFMINARDLLDNVYKYNTKHVAEYIGLASFRAYGDYKMLGHKYLPIYNSPLDIKKIENNELLRIENNNIHFLYEDYTRSNK